MLIKNVPELLKMLNYYKNPYIICHYKGIDWSLYENYSNYYPKEFSFSNKLKIVSFVKDKEYKIKNNDFLYILRGNIIINDYKKINTFYHNVYKDESYEICKGGELNNCFFHYNQDN